MSSDQLTLYALASHATGDFPLQTDWMAENKFDSRVARAAHVAAYTMAFLPVVVASNWTRKQAATFLSVLSLSHFVIDSRRWNEAVPIWYDQALHIISLAVAFALTEGGRDG